MNVADFADRLRRQQTDRPSRPPPPLGAWDPPDCGHSGIAISADGAWTHEGARIGREPLVRLFASILRREAGGYFLVTPVEKMRVDVADAPFVAVRVDRTGEGEDAAIAFTTNVGDVAPLDRDHPLRVEHGRPYVRVRAGLEARILRAPYYELAGWAQERDGAFGVWSGGDFWRLT